METGVVTLNVILLTHYVLLNVSVFVSNNVNDPPINIFDKNFNFSLGNSSRLPYEVKKYQKSNLLVPKSGSNSGNVNISSFLLIDPLSLNFFIKKKKNPIALTFFYFRVFSMHSL